MSERVRGALFNMLGNVQGKTVFDPFAGSGAISFEAISRGAESALAVEKDKKAQSVIAKNIELLGLQDKVRLIRANCSSWSDRNVDTFFDIIIIDPPYNNVDLSTVSKLIRHLKSTGIMVLSHPGRESALTVNGVVVVDDRNYGDAALAFYRKDPSA
jgi:16S rRNA (guanine966-N2)-methyltransferase